MELVGLITLIVQIIPVVFGLYIWYFQDGEFESDVGQSLLMESLTTLIPFVASLIVFKISMDFLKTDLNMLFAENPMDAMG